MVLRLAAFAVTILAAGGAHAAPMVGVKIYETRRDPAALADEWRRLGINTVFASVALNQDSAFRAQMKRAGIARYAIFPVFYDPEALEADPDLHAVTARGERAVEEWVSFVCPTRSSYREKKIDFLRRLVREADPEGISLDFIRHFVFWEKVHPDRAPDAIPHTCFDPSCLAAFEKAARVTIPAQARTTAEKAAWILGHHRERWVQWKCDVITRFVAELSSAAREVKPGVKINLHAVPWRAGDFDGGIRRVAGQDFAALARHVDYLSPMTYHHMVKRPPEWVHAVTREVAEQAQIPVVPSIQVGKAYVENPLATEELMQALQESLKPPSAGVVFWSWQALEDAPEKKAAVSQAIAEPAAAKKKEASRPFRLVIHGGAGAIARERRTPEMEASVRAALTEALKAGHQVLAGGGRALDAVEAAIRILEDSPHFNAGKGAVFTSAGTNELDAAIMDGASLRAGAVAAVKRIKNPISLARLVMERSRHVLLAGDGAETFAREHGMEHIDPSYFHTERRWKELQEAQEKEKNKVGDAADDDIHYGTVGAVALDQAGNLAAGTSTGGLTNKRFGRVGDSPIVGAGTYADNRTCAVSATGKGEYFMRAVAAYDVCARVGYKGSSLQEAADAVIAQQAALGGEGGLIAVDRQGRIALPFNTAAMYRGHVDAAGQIVVAIDPD